MKTEKGYQLIPMNEITDEAREIAVLWGEKLGYDWIGDKHKLASDIMNYAIKFAKAPTPTTKGEMLTAEERKEIVRTFEYQNIKRCGEGTDKVCQCKYPNECTRFGA